MSSACLPKYEMKTSTILAIALFVLCAILSALGGWFGRAAYEGHIAPPVPQTDTVYNWIHDTIKIVESKPGGTIVVTLPEYIHDTIKSQNDTIRIRDSVQVEVPIEQRTYEGENYRAVVQGFRPELVTIDIRQQINTVTEYKSKRWSVTVGPQLGYGFTPAGWHPYAGVGVTFGFSF